MEILITLTSILVLILILEKWNVILITAGVVLVLYIIWFILGKIGCFIMIKKQEKKNREFDRRERERKWK
ncbi:hypothetical protein KIN38_17200 [Vibrio sp. B511a]|uniref:hypothetical protein n=1 Tax=Vibrio sp. B511a TaxID=2835905 RepID=UPI0025566419|nr:hypothetical protein [Vibrio sp. B511a]MDK9734466.1 hypothetical protein [Vibrio sp. B511a]